MLSLFTAYISLLFVKIVKTARIPFVCFRVETQPLSATPPMKSSSPAPISTLFSTFHPFPLRNAYSIPLTLHIFRYPSHKTCTCIGDACASASKYPHLPPNFLSRGFPRSPAPASCATFYQFHADEWSAQVSFENREQRRRCAIRHPSQCEWDHIRFYFISFYCNFNCPHSIPFSLDLKTSAYFFFLLFPMYHPIQYQEMDDDIQIIEPSTNSSPSTYGNLPTPPASEHPQPPSGPATQHRMIPTALQVRLLPPSYNFEHYVMEATRKSFHLQQMLVQGAETVDTINEMLVGFLHSC